MRIRRDQGLIAFVAAWGVALFLLIVVFEHVVNPSLDPARQEISEYVRTPWGWLMVVGFAVWALSLLCTGIVARTRYGADVLCITLAVAALGMAITACFATQASAGRLPPGVSLSTSGRLHDIGSGLATVALFFSALLSLSLRAGSAFRRLTVALLVLACSSDVVLLEVGGSVGGIRQRILVLVGCAWQLAMLTLGATDGRI